jgi:hypothetical protein
MPTQHVFEARLDLIAPGPDRRGPELVRVAIARGHIIPAQPPFLLSFLLDGLFVRGVVHFGDRDRPDRHGGRDRRGWLIDERGHHHAACGSRHVDRDDAVTLLAQELLPGQLIVEPVGSATGADDVNHPVIPP